MSKRANPSSFQLGPELDGEITQMAAALGISRSQLVERAVKHLSTRQKHIGAVLNGARKVWRIIKLQALAFLFQRGDSMVEPGNQE